MVSWRVPVRLIGRWTEPLRRLLIDALREISIEVEPVEQAASLSLVIVEGDDDVSAVSDAHRASTRPVIAVVPLSDERLVERVHRAGARGTWTLDGSLDDLRAIFVLAAGEAPFGATG